MTETWHEMYSAGMPARAIADHLGITPQKMYRKIEYAKRSGHISDGHYGDPFNSKRRGHLSREVNALDADTKRRIIMDCPPDMTLAAFFVDIVRMHYGSVQESG